MSQNQNVKYGGYSTVPSDYDCPDGTLSTAINIIPEDNQLKPILPPKVVGEVGATESAIKNAVIFLHKTASFEHYIIYDSSTNSAYWRKKNSTELKPIQNVYGVTHFNAIGNTLIAFTELDMTYLYWNGSEYENLGNHVPDINISFGLLGRPRFYSLSDESHHTFSINFTGISDNDIYNPFGETQKVEITNQVMAKVNKFIRDQTVNKGRHCFPFFVRYALRMYDGSLVNHSAPILMNPSTTNCPVVFWKHIRGKGSTYKSAELDIMLVAASLTYQCFNYYNTSLEKWGDLITGVELFISKPIYTFDQEGFCTSFNDLNDNDTKFIGKLYASSNTPVSTPTEDRIIGKFANTDFMSWYAEWTYSQIYQLYYSANRSCPSSTLHMPEFSEGKINESIKDSHIFYKLCSIPLADLKKSENGRIEIATPDEYLQSLTSREVMTDDYLMHDRLCAESSFIYNQRLNLSGVKRKLFSGFPLEAMQAYRSEQVLWNYATKADGSVDLDSGTLDIEKGHIYATGNSVTVYIKEGGKDYAVAAGYSGSGLWGMSPMVDFMSLKVMRQKYKIDPYTGKWVNDGAASEYDIPLSGGVYLFYPNVNAFRMVISGSVSNGSYIIDLQPHPFLNGAYAVLEYETVRKDNYDQSRIPTITYEGYPGNERVPVLNKVYTSEVNNPFYFPLLGINTVGTGHIKKICAAVKALSQGQFGQFPLYAFSDEGVWALETNAQGTYSARQPVTRDVCINADAITQIDSAVLFPTDRGIMLIQGSQTQCISESINCETPFDVTCLPQADKLHSIIHENADACIPVVPFTEYLRHCRMIYDYVHQRIIVYCAENISYKGKSYKPTYAYVYSLESQLWGMMRSDIVSNINSYPEALAVNSLNQLVDFSSSDAHKAECLLITRPIKLGAGDVLKTIDTVIQRGNFAKGHVMTALYGSRDLINWQLIWTSKDHYLRGFSGTPFKYFRLAAPCFLDEGESLSGASVSFTPKYHMKLR